MEICITGGTGFIGRYLKEALKTESVKSFGSEIDLRNYKETKNYFDVSNADTLINLAKPSSTGLKFIKEYLEMSINILRSIPIGIRIIHISSMVVYGNPEYFWSLREDGPVNPLDNYAMGKLIADYLIEQCRRDFDLDCWILRFGGVFSKERKTGALYNFITKALKNEDICLTVDKPTPWEIIHIDDVIDGIKKVHYSDKIGGGIINLSYGNHPWTLNSLPEKIIKMTGSKSKIVNPSGIKHPIANLDNSKAKELLGWSPVLLEDRLWEMIEAWKES